MQARTENEVRSREQEEAGATATGRGETQAARASDAAGNGHARQEGTQERKAAAGDKGSHTATIRTPFGAARFEVPRAPGKAIQIGRAKLPSPAQTGFYLGLGALAIVEVVEWPVAAAIGVGTYIAQRGRGGARETQAEQKGPVSQAAQRTQADDTARTGDTESQAPTGDTEPRPRTGEASESRTQT